MVNVYGLQEIIDFRNLIIRLDITELENPITYEILKVIRYEYEHYHFLLRQKDNKESWWMKN